MASRGDLPRDKALQLYTGNHWRVEAAILAEVEHFTRFAVRSIRHPPMLAYPQTREHAPPLHGKCYCLHDKGEPGKAQSF